MKGTQRPKWTKYVEYISIHSTFSVDLKQEKDTNYEGYEMETHEPSKTLHNSWVPICCATFLPATYFVFCCFIFNSLYILLINKTHIVLLGMCIVSLMSIHNVAIVSRVICHYSVELLANMRSSCYFLWARNNLIFHIWSNHFLTCEEMNQKSWLFFRQIINVIRISIAMHVWNAKETPHIRS